jgi:hypothetical protein
MSTIHTRPFVVFSLLVAATAGVCAQQPDPPPRAGTSGVPVPMIKTFVSPAYPSNALLDQSLWTVQADAWVDADGRIENVHVVQPEAPAASDAKRGTSVSAESINDVRRAVEEGVRDWVFDPPLVKGQPTALIVPVTVRYEVFGQPIPSFFKDPAPASAMPADFSLRYVQGDCTLDTRAGVFSVVPGGASPAETVHLSLRSDELDSIYQEMRRVRMFEYPERVHAQDVHGSSAQRDALFALTGEGIVVVMRLDLKVPQRLQPVEEYLFEVQQNGVTSIVRWTDASAGPAIAREVEGMRAIVAVVKRLIDRHPEIRDLEGVARGCGPMPRSDFRSDNP